MSNPVSGFGYFLKGLTLITKPGVKRYVVIPIVINFVIFASLFWLLGGYVDEQIQKYVPELPQWLAWIEWLIWVLFFLLAILLMATTFTFLANLVGAPFNSFLAIAVERHMTGRNPPGSERQLMAEFSVMMLSELKKWLYFLLWAIPLAIISMILLFVFPPVVPIIWFIFGSWMYSIEYADYPMGNYGLTFSEIRKELAKKRMLSLGFGGTVTVASMIPVINFFVMPVAVAGATAMRIEQYPLSIPGPSGLDTP
jgi:CysZ protein